MRRSWFRITSGRLALAAPLLVLASGPARAQRVEVAPTIGLYWPVGGWEYETVPSAGGELRLRQVGAMFFGTRVGVWVSKRLGFEGSVGFSPAQVALTEVARTVDRGGAVVMGSMRVVVPFASLSYGDPGDRMTWEFELGAGAAVIARRGDVWRGKRGATAPAALLSFGARTELGRAVAMFVRLEDHVSWGQFDRGLPTQTRARVHHDAVGSFGWAIVLRRW